VKAMFSEKSQKENNKPMKYQMVNDKMWMMRTCVID